MMKHLCKQLDLNLINTTESPEEVIFKLNNIGGHQFHNLIPKD